MEMIRELPRDTEHIERGLAQHLMDEVPAWRRARSQRYGLTATGVPVVRRTQRPRRLQPEAPN